MKFPLEEQETPQRYLEYLLEQGLKGNHLLFDVEDIKHAMKLEKKDLTNIEPGKVQEVNKAIQEILSITGIEDKRDFIKDLPKDIQEVIIHLYFQMIDRTMVISHSTVH